MKTSTVFYMAASLFAASALAAPAETPEGVSDILTKRSGFLASCWDLSINKNYLYATCSSGGAGSPAIRSAVDINSRITNVGGSLKFDC